MSKDFTWDLDKLYHDEETLKIDVEKCLQASEQFIADFKDIEYNQDNLLLSIQGYFQINRDIRKPLTYSNHRLDEDTSVEGSVRLNNYVRNQVTVIFSNLSFYIPSLNQNLELLQNALTDNRFSSYSRFLHEVIRNCQYTLNQQLEKMLADSAQVQMQPNLIYDALTTTDMKFADIVDVNGNSHEMSHGLYSVYLQGADRELRKGAFTEMLETFGNLNNSLTRVYLGQIASEIFGSNARGFETLRYRALFNNQIDEQVYDNLLAVVTDNIEINHQYVELRKQQLGVSQLHLYDMYTPLVANVAKEYTFAEGKALVLAALAPLGEDYSILLNKAFDERWIDVYERPGKQTGAYSGGCYDSYPYILLNFNGTLNDVYTLAHELGHSIHTYLSNNAQEFQNSGYTIFIAEIASTLNELLLTDYLLEIATSKEEQAYILNYKLEQYRTTVIRQTMFAEFEYLSKTQVENNQPLAASDLNQIYLQLNHKYFGPSVEIDDLIKYEWSRIPHFYYDYYVYQYATSFCYSVDIYNRLKTNRGFSSDYLNFLRIGDSLSPMDSLSQIAIDGQSKVPYQNAMQDFKYTLDELKKIIK